MEQTRIMNTPIISEETRERDKIARLSRSLYERGLTAGSSGLRVARLTAHFVMKMGRLPLAP
jgi:ribulose-5-phosphate 4-epimerase/fuculose-1-phosphate aldolase